jgi:hypothetical protein
MGTFGLAFGICLESNLTFGESFGEKIRSVLKSAYWPLFGEIEDVLNKLDKLNCTSSEENACMSSFTHTTSYVLIMIYLLIGSILLINLLIAIFRYIKFFNLIDAYLSFRYKLATRIATYKKNQM